MIRDDLGIDKIVLFALDEPLYGLPLSLVERVVRAVEIRSLPRAPRIVMGVINAGGRIVPVVDLRLRFGLPSRAVNGSDRFILARTSGRVAALVVDRVIGIREFPEAKMARAGDTLPFAEHLRGVVQMEDGLALIYDLDRFLSLDEERALDGALSGSEA
ncbi:MAG: chemotaxis protein CheW [Rectinemataceae bacterium]